MTDYTKMNTAILTAVGGAENVTDLIHCATRLRFTLKDRSKVDEAAVKKIPGVIGTAEGAGSFHVLIGTHVGDVYEQFLTLPGLKLNGASSKSAGAENTGSKEKIGLLDRFTKLMSDVYAPYIPILATGGIASGVIGLLANMGVVSSESLTYQTFYAIFYALIYFFPILLGFTAGKHYKCNPYVSATIGAALLYPGVSDLLVTGETASLMGIHFTAYNFAGSFIPILLAVFCMSYVERWLKQVLPQVVQFILVPAVCLCLFVPLSILVFGPIGGMVGNLIRIIYDAISGIPLLTSIIFGACFSLIILLGMHWAVLPILLGVMAEQGSEVALAAGGMGNYVILGICLAVGLFAKNKNDQGTALSAAFTNALCGITEPGLYGIVLRSKKLLGVMLASGALAGLVLGLGHVAATNFAFSGILSFGAWLTCVNFPMYCAGIVTAIGCGFAGTAFMLKSKQVSEFNDPDTEV